MRFVCMHDALLDLGRDDWVVLADKVSGRDEESSAVLRAQASLIVEWHGRKLRVVRVEREGAELVVKHACRVRKDGSRKSAVKGRRVLESRQAVSAALRNTIEGQHVFLGNGVETHKVDCVQPHPAESIRAGPAPDNFRACHTFLRAN
jgi:hypothetical protein